MDTQPPANEDKSWAWRYVDAKLSRYKLKLGISGGVSVRNIYRAFSATTQEWPIVFVESEDENQF